ncbi:MAG: hypothetical protein ACKN9D_16780 [Actinomycetales bacterium]|jgi:hypothetical protein
MKTSLTSRRVAAFGIAALAAVGLGAPALAMGSGNPFLDMQTGVTYTVYQPTFTAGLKLQHVGPNLMSSQAGAEQNMLATYGKGNGRNIDITEGNPLNSDIGQGPLVKTITIQGRAAKVYAYCDPASNAPCSLNDIGKVGGHIQVTLPAKAGLRETIVQVETIQPNPISGQQLIKVAQSLQPVQ